MKRVFISVIAIILLVACTSNRDKALNEIKEYESSIDIQNTKVVLEVGENLIRLYTQFAKDFPADSLAPMYLMKSADVAANINRSDLSIKYLDMVISQYPNYSKLPECYFFKGFVYETVIGDTEKAKEVYSAFLDKYPSHHMASNAKMIIENLSLSEEDLLNMIISKNKDN